MLIIQILFCLFLRHNSRESFKNSFYRVYMGNVCHLDQIMWDKIALLQSYEGYREWYLTLHRETLTIFSQDAIDGLIEEVEPGYYPCYALPQNGTYKVIYLDPDLLFFITEELFIPVDDLSTISM